MDHLPARTLHVSIEYRETHSRISQTFSQVDLTPDELDSLIRLYDIEVDARAQRQQTMLFLSLTKQFSWC